MSDNDIRERRLAFHRKLRGKELLEGYSYDDGKDFVTRPYWPMEPKNQMKPHLWRWQEIRPLVLECGEMVGLGHGSSKYDRRVLALSNPGSNGDYTLSGPLFGDIQLIRPGESAPSHRHTPCATRFILEGSGGWTTVAGDRVHVSPGDVIYTGQFPWHGHGNDGSDDFIFLDVLDIPLLYFTGTSSWEFDYESVTGGKETSKRTTSDLAYLAWKDIKNTMADLNVEKVSPYDGMRLEFQNTDGGPVGPTVSVHTQWIRAGELTLTHRHTGAFIYVCAEGHGRAMVEDQTFEFGPRDIFVIPSWHWHSFESKGGCYLHSISDLSLIQKMCLYREQRKTTNGKILDSGWTSLTEPFE